MNEDADFLSGRRILIVEDDYLIAEDLSSMVQNMGGKVLGPTGRISAAIDLIRDGKPDLGLLDVNLGGERVYDIAMVLQNEGVPFAFVTGYDANVIEARFRGCPYLEKPISEPVLADALRAIIS